MHVVVNADVKTSIVSPATNKENTVEDSQQSDDIAEPSLSALMFQTFRAWNIRG